MSEAINWRSSWDAALEEAKKAKRPLVLELYMEGCPHCLRLDRETHADGSVAAALNSRFVPVRLEGRGHMDLVQKFKVPGAPTTLFFLRKAKSCTVLPVSRPLRNTWRSCRSLAETIWERFGGGG
jgi:thioredoxin-related protein